MGVKSFAEWCHSHKDELEEAMRKCEGPDPELLAGFEWDGWTKPRLPWTKFRKGFLKFSDGKVVGYNSRMQSNDFNDSWLYMPGKEPFGFFEVYPAKDDPKANIYPNATLINYHTGKNDLITEATKDYLVELKSPKDQTILLGKMHILLDDLVNDLTKHQSINGCKHIPVPPYYPYFFLKKAERISSAKEKEIKKYLK